MQRKFTEYVNEINRLRKEHNLEELELLIHKIVHILPSNVKSLSVPIFGDEKAEYITAEKESPTEEQKIDWSLGNLIAYSISLRENSDNKLEE